MLFTSYAFLGFLAVLIPAYYILPKRLQQPLLLAASCLFYLISGPENLLYILVTTLTTYLTGRSMGRSLEEQKTYLRAHKEELSREEQRAYREGRKRLRRRLLAGCLLLNLGILAVVKYANFAIANANALLSALGRSGTLSFLDLALPLGISFYTFQAMGYLIDVYRGTVEAEKSPFRLALFVSFFPLLIQGPISRYGDLAQTLYGPHPFDAQAVSRGLQRMLWGFFKKLVVADRFLTAVSAILSDSAAYRGAYVPVVMLFYSVELYADFSGGIDVTIGVAQALGVRVQENFLRPYFSKSLKEYWRRWHISMCAWFRDYLFYPVSTSKAMQKFSRLVRSRLGDKAGRRLPVYVSSFVVWFATGIWHGASWNFILWGLANWAVLMLSEELEPCYARFHDRFPGLGRRWGYRLFQVLRTFALVCVLNLFDCYASLGELFGLYASVFTAQNWHILWDGSLLELGLTGLDYAILLGGCGLMLAVSLLQRKGSLREQIGQKPYPVRFLLWYGLFLLVLLMGTYGVGYDASQFIYNQF